MEIMLKEISFEEYIGYSKLAFEGDIDMQTRYGTIDPGEMPADRNIKNIREFRSLNPNYKCKFYGIMLETVNGGQPIGMMVIANIPYSMPLLYSFGINIEFRTGEILRKWMEEVDVLLGKNYIVSLFLKNTRAIKFFTKNGFTNTMIDDNGIGIKMWR